MKLAIRKLNEPYRRIDFVIGGLCAIGDGLVSVLSVGYVSVDLHLCWMRITTKKALAHLEDEYNGKEV